MPFIPYFSSSHFKVTRQSQSGPLKALVMDQGVQAPFPSHPGPQDPTGAAYMGQYPQESLQGPGFPPNKPANTKTLGNGILMVIFCVSVNFRTT